MTRLTVRQTMKQALSYQGYKEGPNEASATSCGPTTPFTFANSDWIFLTGYYEVA